MKEGGRKEKEEEGKGGGRKKEGKGGGRKKERKEKKGSFRFFRFFFLRHFIYFQTRIGIFAGYRGSADQIFFSHFGQKAL